jgi:tRNA-2-methylthio-N6-dimethylallyladenosine synthase
MTEEPPVPRVFVQTWGCQMNDSDTGKMLALLAKDGFVPTDLPDEADLLLVNTCAVRAKPEHKLFSFLGRAALLKRTADRPILLAVAGCIAQRDGARLLAEHPEVDLVFGPDAIPRVRELVEQARLRRVIDLRRTDDPSIAFVPDLVSRGGVSALVTIQKGCDNHCTYCAVPLARGAETSRASSAILSEVRALVERGARDITLLGQNVDSYGRKRAGEISFAGLLREVAAVPGLLRLRFMTSHPRDLSADVVDCYAKLEKLGAHLHLPVQSGSDRILRRMGRGVTRERYLTLVKSLREARTGISLTTDFIVGFPGETEQDFEDSLALLEEVRFDASFSFVFSPRPKTPAQVLHLREAVPASVAAKRLGRLQALQLEISRASQAAFVGREVEVLVDGTSRQDALELSGRTSCFRTVNFQGTQDMMGRLVRVRIDTAGINSLHGLPAA